MKSLDIPKADHGRFPSSKRLVEIFGSVFWPPSAELTIGDAGALHCGTISLRGAIFFESEDFRTERSGYDPLNRQYAVRPMLSLF